MHSLTVQVPLFILFSADRQAFVGKEIGHNIRLSFFFTEHSASYAREVSRIHKGVNGKCPLAFPDLKKKNWNESRAFRKD
jgi:hypothetical protein